MPKVSLTPQVVATAKCPAGKRKVDLFDVTTKGLMLEVREAGGRTYYLRYQDQRDRTRQLKLADTRDVSLSQARTLADKARNRIAMGEDPGQDKATVRAVPTFAQYIEQQYLPYVKTYKRSWQTDVSLLKNHLLPALGHRFMDEITRQDIVRLHQGRIAAGAKPGTANRVLIMMRFMFNQAIRWQVPGVKANPCANVPLLEENNKHERFLTADEAKRLYEAVCASPNPMLRYIVPLLILTGARKRELLDAKWEDFDLERRTWRIPMTKTGKARHVPLNDGALQILSMIPRHGDCEWVVPNPATGKPYVSIFAAWNTARSKAGLTDVRIHDLRHSFASLLINQGRTLYEVQHLLGHTQVKTTQRYAHLSQDTLLAASNAATRALDGYMMPMAILDTSRSQAALPA